MLRRIIAATASMALTIAVASPAFAYWEYGHETVAEIAMANVKPATRAHVLALLRQSALLDTPGCPAATPAEAAVWPDCVKKLGDRFKNTFSWHYTDIEICEPFDLKSACKDGNCAAAQIEKDVKLLESGKGTTKDRLTALVFLIHLVGDIHQPLHSSDNHDMGGNKVAASYGIYSPPHFNLHSIWDGPLAERAITSGPSLIRRYPSAVKAALQAGSVADWSRQSWEIAQKSVYASVMNGQPCGPEPTSVKMDEATIEKEVPVARLQVKRGGLRLAKLLDQALG
ncbi:MAG: S1/P1 nuclease [Sphingomonas sp.]